jgi:hypothetical protein
MNQKYFYNTIKQEFSDNGCELLEDIYINCDVPMLYKCKCGTISKIAYKHFKKGVRCRICQANKKRLSYEDVKNYFKLNECILLQDNYIDNNTLMKFQCKCGHISNTRFRTFQKTHGCVKCGYKKTHAHTRANYNEIKKFFDKQGCELLEKNYINNRTPMRYRCLCGNESTIMWQNFKKGQRCKKCGIDNVSGSNASNWLMDRELFAINNKFRQRCRSMLHRVLKEINENKTTKTTVMLGYSFEQFKNRIMNHPNWEKVKNKDWSIDHIFPITAFIDYGIKDVKLINSLDNLQPMTKSNNCKKHNKYNRSEFEKWIQSKLTQNTNVY